MAVYTDVLQLHLKLVSATLAAVLGDDYASYIKAFSLEFLDQTEHIYVISDTQVVAYLAFFNISSADNDDYFCLIS